MRKRPKNDWGPYLALAMSIAVILGMIFYSAPARSEDQPFPVGGSFFANHICDEDNAHAAAAALMVPDAPLDAECRFSVVPTPFTLREYIFGPVKDRDGDCMWVVRSDEGFHLLWQPGNRFCPAPGQPV